MIAAFNNALASFYVRYTTEEEGQTMAEYGLIIALVAVAAVAGFTALGGNIAARITAVGSTIAP